MDKILSTIYLKVKSETQTLTKSAIAQIIVKIIYSSENRMTFEQIISAYKAFKNRKTVDETVLFEILSNLVKTSEIKISSKNEYYIIDSRRKQIQAHCENSIRRNEELINKYFTEVHSDRAKIKEWLQDITIHFFRLFSDEWIADLLKTNRAVIHSKDSIRDLVETRTKAIKGIDKKDYAILPDLFFKFVGANDPDVAAYLWEYGTSAFSAKLISNTTGVDRLTLDVFKDSKCLLDTNILMFIKLDSSKFHKALISLENSFKNLGIQLGVLYITKTEFQRKIDQQRQLTLSNLEKYGYNITAESDDDFTRTALTLRCRRKEDFCTYFEQLRELPKFMNESLVINEVDSKELAEIIDIAENNEEKTNELNAIFKAATGRDKRPAALTHDVGLIAGAENLRNNDKVFILSEEISINNYSKNKPLVMDLPLAVRIETLINVLALNNGGDAFDADDYMPLFASIIQNGFQPPKDTFKQEDLYAIYELNQQIALLPDDKKKEIVYEINSKRLKGISEDALKVDLERAITRGKMQISDDLNDTREELARTRNEAKRQQNRGDGAMEALRNQVSKEVRTDYKRKLAMEIAIPLIGIPLITFAIIVIFNKLLQYFDAGGQSISYIVNIVAGISLDIIYFICYGFKRIVSTIKNKEKYISEETEKRVNASLNSPK